MNKLSMKNFPIPHTTSSLHLCRTLQNLKAHLHTFPNSTHLLHPSPTNSSTLTLTVNSIFERYRKKHPQVAQENLESSCEGNKPPHLSTKRSPIKDIKMKHTLT
eukprot:c7623_g1_i1 orf=310-621(-)